MTASSLHSLINGKIEGLKRLYSQDERRYKSRVMNHEKKSNSLNGWEQKAREYSRRELQG